MTHPALMKMLEKYDLSNSNNSFDALREILQEIVLLGLYDAGFFKHATFYGGTALRILHNLPRFSEDLDFSLLEVNPDFDLTPFREAIVSTLESFGFDVTMEIREKNKDSAIASAFVKGNTLEHLININTPKDIANKIHKDQVVKIKIEVDTNPPLDFETENIIRLIPRAFSINTMTLSSLYAGKIHAVLCRSWGKRPKGRDWYDFVWYVANNIELDLKHLQARLNQSCKYFNDKNIDIPSALIFKNVKGLLQQRVSELDISKAKSDVRPFIKDARELELWSEDFFMEIIQRVSLQLLTKNDIEQQRTPKEFIEWWDTTKSNIVELGNDMRHSVLLKDKKEYKLYMEESLPLRNFCQHYFKDYKRNVTIKQIIGNQNYDAIVKGCEDFDYIEITYAINGEAEHARMVEMIQKGSTNPFGTVYKKGTKNKGLDVSTEEKDNSYRSLDEKDIRELLKKAVDKKVGKKYPQKTLLLVYFDDTKLEMYQDISKDTGENYDYKKDIEGFVNQTLFPKITSVFSGIALVGHNSCIVKIALI